MRSWLLALVLAVPPALAALPPATDPGEPPAADAAAAATTAQEAITYANGSIPLAAELLLPAASGPAPGAVILQGSGASDRSNAWARGIAEELRGHGLAVLLTDKRGSGESGGDWRGAGFGDLAGDAVAGVAYLAGRPEVDAERIGVVGLSQGGWVAPIAAAGRPQEVAFVVVVSGAAVSFAEQTFAEMANTSRQAGLPEAQVREVLEVHRLAGRYLMNGEWDAYAEARERGLESPWGEIAAGFPGERDDPIWTFLRRVASFDPMPYWLQVPQPVLVLYGAEDEADNVPVAESVRRLEFGFGLAGKENAEIVVVPGAGHAVWDHEAGGLHPAAREALAAWLGEHRLTAAAAATPATAPEEE